MEKVKHITFWWDAHGEDKRPKKRYAIIWNLFNDSKRLSMSVSEFDDLNDCLNECTELNEMYKNHPLPIKIDEIWNGTYPKNIQHIINKYDFSDNRSWWGYIVIDMHDCKCIKIGGYGLKISSIPIFKKLPTSKTISQIHKEYIYVINKIDLINKNLSCKDYFFRDTKVCPEEYEFDGEEEYVGWLQYRWGDGKNAIDYVESHKKELKNKESDISQEEFEYEEDYSISEEINEPTTTSISNILGDNNPLLKLLNETTL